MFNTIPRIIIAALKGGSGKTVLSLGLTSAWRERGHKIAPFKKGPDFIDAGWLTFTAGRNCHNLDPFMMTESQMAQSFFSNSAGADLSLIEGNRGLFDGLDPEGCCSTAELAKLFSVPIVIIADVTMATRTVAASILGCQKFDPALEIVAVVLNRVAGARQEALVRSAVERYCGIPVIGAIPKLKNNLFPERHMGLVPYQERDQARKAVAWARQVVEDHLDLDMVWTLAHDVESIDRRKFDEERAGISIPEGNIKPRIGFLRDRAFWFYYPENLSQLRKLGAKLVRLNAINDRDVPQLDALYIGGGFPETQAGGLSMNRHFKESIRNLIEGGLPVYAECGGLMYLGENIVSDGNFYPMVGALPIDFVLEKKPQGHGYTILEVTEQNPYYEVGERIKGHEFHYSRALVKNRESLKTIFKVNRGHGLDGQVDGLYRKNLLATYTHVHAGGNTTWAENFFRAAVHSKSGMP